MEFDSMADKIFILIISVDLSCCCCRKKIQKYLCQIRCRECILGIVYDVVKNVVVIKGPFNPHELKWKLICKLPRVIRSIEVKEEVSTTNHRNNRPDQPPQTPNNNISMNITVNGACAGAHADAGAGARASADAGAIAGSITGTDTGTSTGTGNGIGCGTSMNCCFRPCPCPCNSAGWNNYYRCCSCGAVVVGQGGDCHGATLFPPYVRGCNSSCTIVVQDYSDPCSIM